MAPNATPADAKRLVRDIDGAVLNGYVKAMNMPLVMRGALAERGIPPDLGMKNTGNEMLDGLRDVSFFIGLAYKAGEKEFAKNLLDYVVAVPDSARPAVLGTVRDTLQGRFADDPDITMLLSGYK